MAIAILTENLAVHQSMADEPNGEDGLTAGEVKAKFDQAALAIQKYLNETVVPAVNAAGEGALELARIGGWQDSDLSSTRSDAGSGPCDAARRQNNPFSPALQHWDCGFPGNILLRSKTPSGSTWKGHGSAPDG